MGDCLFEVPTVQRDGVVVGPKVHLEFEVETLGMLDGIQTLRKEFGHHWT